MAKQESKTIRRLKYCFSLGLLLIQAYSLIQNIRETEFSSADHRL